MADFDEYALLEAAVDGKPPPVPAPEEKQARDSSRSKDGARDERERSKERSKERSGKEKRHRSRSRSRDRDRKRSSRDRSRERERERDKDRLSRGDRERDRDRERRSSRDHRDRDHRQESPSKPRRREATPPEVRLAREKERELKELERATRTVFAFNLSVKADERDIFDFFSKAGEVTDIRIITDRHTRRSKGLAYVEFSKQDFVFAALALTGQPFMGQPVMVKPAEAEKNVAWEAAQAAKANQSDAATLLQAAGLAVPPPAAAAAALPVALPQPALGGAVPGVTIVPAGNPLNLRVSGFPAGLGEVELRQVFEPFGAIADVTMVKDSAGNDYAVDILFSREAEGQAAMAHWNGNELIGCRLTVKIVPLDVNAPPPPGAVGAVTAAAGATAAMAAASLGGAAGGDVAELDDEEGGLRLNSQARAALMSRLAGGAAPLPGPPPLPGAPPLPPAVLAGGQPQVVLAAGAPNIDPSVLFAQGALGPPSPIPTQCVLLKNVWRPEQAQEPGWEVEVTEDMREECAKCGQLLHLFLDPASPGCVYIKFGAVEGAQAAHKLLNGRFYQGNQIIVDYQFLQPYNAHFGVA